MSNTLLIILICYFVYVYLFSYIYFVKKAYINSGFKDKFFTLLFLLLFLPFVMVFMPFAWMYWLFVVLDRIKIDKFTIHPLTEENKIALRQLGFYESDNLTSRSNFSYAGFVKFVQGTAISVCLNGKCSIDGDVTEKVKHIKQQIMNLPDCEKNEEDEEKTVE